MAVLNTQTKTCVVQTFTDAGQIHNIVDVVDCKVRDYIDIMQQDWWFVQNIQHTVLEGDGSGYVTYLVHIVMSRMYDK